MLNLFAKNKVVAPNRGITLVELVVSLAIFSVIGLIIGMFGRDIFSFNSFIQSDLNAQFEGRRAIVRMVSEMREMSPSSLGAYPIATAGTSTLIFFSDIDADTMKEQVRYYIQGQQILRGVIEPVGTPPVYDINAMVVRTVVSDIGNGTSTPLFQYFDTNYSGTTTPLAIPVNISSIRLIQIQALVDSVSSRGNSQLMITSQVTPRNLKDNL